ncbi:retinol dehydrogenase 8-like [Acanthaster planci]|uniref:Retinol dehydrogenase 8-like n=1 Tax=Acanthaster planci TaxID=133434 RepID=A0A8B8A7V5_ACAPL|nr:retinol dehydrogenase 8-like [Acanthaster planci]
MARNIVLITGCSSGIGLATAVRLAKDPEHRYKVYATMRNLGKKERLETAGGDALDNTLFVRRLDVTKDETIKALVEDIVREDGKIDVLVNNAGSYGCDAIFHQSLEWCQEMMDTNFWGAVRLTRAVLPTMQEHRSGRIINISSTSGINALPFFGIYSASKFALEGYSESIAPVLRDAFNIRVSLIQPSGVATDLIANFYKVSFEEQAKDFGDVLRPVYVDMMNGWAAESAKIGPMQTGEDLAQLIQEVVETENPHLRYQANETVKQLAGWKWTDPTGDSYLSSLK